MKVLLAGGGTAGHTSPLLATADAVRRLDPSAEIVCLGTERGLEVRLVPEAGYPLELVPPVPLPRSLSADLLRVPGRVVGAARAADAVLRRVRPDVVVGYGGYVAVPAYLAARRRGIPIVVHEQNAVPGVANRVGARLARRVAVSFPGTPLRRAEYVGLPLRSMVAQLDRIALRPEALAFFGLEPGRPVVLVTGGSQGARRLNVAIEGAVDALVAAGAQVLHAVGAKNELPAARPGYVPVAYIDRMDYALAAASLTICRAGSSSVVEAAATGLPAVFVPLPIGNGEQARNARPVVEAGGALLATDAEFDADWVRAHIVPLVQDADRLAAMSSAAEHLVPRDAADRLARLIREVADESARGGVRR